MALVSCPGCDSQDLDGVPLPNGQIQIACQERGEEWLRGKPRKVYESMRTYDNVFMRLT